MTAYEKYHNQANGLHSEMKDGEWALFVRVPVWEKEEALLHLRLGVRTSALSTAETELRLNLNEIDWLIDRLTTVKMAIIEERKNND